MQQPVHFKNHLGEKLSGILHLPDRTTDRGVVVGHCFTCSRNTRILQQIGEDLTQAGFLVLRFDFSGNGRSEGDFGESSYSKHVAEMTSAVDFIAEQGAPHVGLAGHSMGATIALLTAAELPAIKAVCSLAGRLSSTSADHFLNAYQLEELAQAGRVSFTSRGRSLELSKNFFIDAARHDLPKLIKTIKFHLLVVHGDKDEIVPVTEARKAHEAKPTRIDLAVIPGADHMFSADNHRLQASALVVDWFDRQVTRTVAGD